MPYRARSALVLVVGLAACGLPARAATRLDPRDATRALLSDGYYAAAESSARVVMERARATPGKDSLDWVTAADLQAESLWRLGRVSDAEALDLASAAVRITTRRFGPDRPEVAACLMVVGDVYKTRNEFRTASTFYRRALAIRERMRGPDDLETAASLIAVARAVSDSNVVAAVPLFERALAIRQRRLPPDDPDVARASASLAWGLRQANQLAESKARFEKTIAAEERILRPDHPDLASSIFHYASCLRLMNDLHAARPLLQRALAIRERSLGPTHPDVGWCLFELGIVDANTGAYDEGRAAFERAIRIFMWPESALPIAEGRARTSLGYLLTQAGEFREARTQTERGIAIVEQIRGPDHPGNSGMYGDFGTLLMTMGDFETARTVLEHGYTLDLEAFGPHGIRVGYFLLKLGNLAIMTGRFADAESLLERSAAIKEAALGRDAGDLVAPLTYLGAAEYQLGKFERARDALERAAAIERETRVHGVQGGLEIDLDLALVDEAEGRDAEAREHYAAALARTEQVLGPEHPTTGSTLGQYGEFLARTGAIAAAIDTSLLAERIGRDHMRLTARVLSERQALDYAASRGTGLPAALTLAASGLDRAANARVWDTVIRSRAMVLDEMAARHRATAGGPHARALEEASARLAKLTVQGPGANDVNYREDMDRAREAMEHAERELGESGEADPKRELGAAIGLDSVAAHVPRGSALVGYASYDRLEPRRALAPRGADAAPVPLEQILARTPSYLAFVIRGGERAPEVVALGTRAHVDSLVARWGDQISRGTEPGRRGRERSYRPAGIALRAAIWDPLASHLGRATRVFVVPDGALSLVNLATLPVGRRDYLVESGPLIHVLATERDLVTESSAVTPGAGMLAMGGADFDGAPILAAAGAGTPAHGGLPPTAFRGQRSECGDLQTIRWPSLPGTLAEAREVATIWESAAKAANRAEGSAVVLTGADADEQTFKARAPGARVLHLATHGFFLDGSCALASATRARGIGSLGELPAAAAASAMPEPTSKPVAFYRENPLLQSGLVLAGANRRGQTGAERDDGILTAEEIAALDLSGVEWAVLSACETGVGEVRSGEGVFGLRRAFQIAGARTTIMSLWSVDDEATRAWMKSLYAARFERRLGTAEAVRAASLERLRARRAAGVSTLPFYWGAFVAAGDWR